MVTIDELLTRYDENTADISRTWQELILATVGLGAAVARFTDAVEAYTDASNGEDQ